MTVMMRLKAWVGGVLVVGTVAGCAAILGDFDVEPDATSSGGAEAGTSSSSSSSGEGGGPTDSATLDSPANECEGGTKECVLNRPRHCEGGRWVVKPCSDDRPICVAGDCALPASCSNLLGNCPGPNSCCSAPVVPGDTFNRYNRAGFPARVSDVRINRFEVTVARFRAFVMAGRGITPSAPAAGAGAHPKVPNSGWQVGYNANLLATTAALENALTSCGGFANATYQPAGVITSNNKPINCVSFFEALAFCIWDGGRLPTIAELENAVRAGREQRAFPWGAAALDTNHAFLCPNAAGMPCTAPLPNPPGMIDVGSKPAGVGKFGHADLFGSVREYTLDIFTPMPAMCNDCVQLDTTAATTHGALGGSWADTADQWPSIHNAGPTTSTNPRTPAGGFRCAYDLP